MEDLGVWVGGTRKEIKGGGERRIEVESAGSPGRYEGGVQG